MSRSSKADIVTGKMSYTSIETLFIYFRIGYRVLLLKSLYILRDGYRVLLTDLAVIQGAEEKRFEDTRLMELRLYFIQCDYRIGRSSLFPFKPHCTMNKNKTTDAVEQRDL